jgi:hypothetical protein
VFVRVGTEEFCKVVELWDVKVGGVYKRRMIDLNKRKRNII